MRASGVAAVFAAAVLAACATGGVDPAVDAGPSPFPVERGTAPPPPAPGAGRAAPPEGAAHGGVDFGRWRQADPAVYAPAFQAQLRARYANQDAARIRADLEANGFACQEANRLDCRIEIMERQCAFDWYVVVESGRSEPIAGFDQMCLGAR
jgi:hypothetical protein